MEDLHVILLKKNLNNPTDDTLSWLPNNATRWIALGHFDEIYIYPLDTKAGFFATLQQDKLRISPHNHAAMCYHPLYLVPERDNIDATWDKLGFGAIVRIHLVSTQKLLKQFLSLSEQLTEYFEKSKLSYRIYHATEFSDIVLDIRSNHFRQLLNSVLMLRQHADIGKMYTYFGLNTTYLSSDYRFNDPSDVIPMLSIRFSGSSLDIASKQIKLIKENLGDVCEYSVNGVDDILLIYNNLQTYKLISLYRTWFFNDNYADIRQSESVTRIGIEVNIDNHFQCNKDIDLAIFGENLISLRDQAAELSYVESNIKRYSWFPSISELTNSLVRMCTTPVLDEVVYLLAPAVEAFLKNILHLMRKSDTPLDPNCENIYTAYVENCTYFMEQLLRIEGQLSQYPEVRPAIYDIPIFMLEYTVAFLYEVTSLLQKQDNNKKLRHIFLPLPRPCDHLAASELFSANGNLPGLILLQIPIKDFYSPVGILRALCHEISHYVGEKYRCRITRRDYYCHSVAVLLSDYIFDTDAHGLSIVLQNLFINSLSSNRSPTISEMHNATDSVVEQLFYSDESLSDFFCYYLMSTESIEDAPIAFPDRAFIIQEKENFARRCIDLDILFREIYADICMLYFLDVPRDDYIESLLAELATNPDPRNTANDMFALRIFIALTATGKYGVYERNHFRDLWSNIRIVINMLNMGHVTTESRRYRFPFPIEVVHNLQMYAQDCYSIISQSVYQSDTDTVRNMIKKINDTNFTYAFILEKIEKCRTNMLKLISE